MTYILPRRSCRLTLLSYLLLPLAIGCDPEAGDDQGAGETGGATEGEIIAACEAAESADTPVPSPSMTLGAFPVEDDDDYQLDDLPCTVAEVTHDMASGDTTTTLSCADPMGDAHTLALTMPTPYDLPVAWAAEMPVRLSARTMSYAFSGHDLEVALRSEAGDLLLFASSIDPIDSPLSQPLALESEPIGCSTSDTFEYHVVTIGTDAAQLELIQGEHGVLEVPEGRFAVQIPSAATGDFGEDNEFFVVQVAALAEP